MQQKAVVRNSISLAPTFAQNNAKDISLQTPEGPFGVSKACGLRGAEPFFLNYNNFWGAQLP